MVLLKKSFPKETTLWTLFHEAEPSEPYDMTYFSQSGTLAGRIIFIFLNGSNKFTFIQKYPVKK